DSSICLALMLREYKTEEILSLGFKYNQRHSAELFQAEKIAKHFGVERRVVDLSLLSTLTRDALTDSSIPIEHLPGEAPNTLVVGRNGLMARLAAIHAHHLGAGSIVMGVMELEGANSGYRDCSRAYMDKMQEILRLDLDNPHFTIRTPLVKMTKRETMELADSLGVLEYLLENTISCYEGLFGRGCGRCPACLLRNEGIDAFYGTKV
ncbi:MAG: 7-cyano-7-deazaguanine synthase QueC, partial [Chlamydiia bacterium]|nr:7-cyano-7-deazaguanine synthase QueC [Chlamydiia bacterium]